MKRKMKGKALSTAVSAYNRDGGAGHAVEVLQGIPVGTGRVPTILTGIPNQSIPVPNQEDMGNSIPYPADFYSVSIPGDITDFLTIFKLSNLNYLLILLRHNFLGGIPKPEYIDYIRSLQLRLNGTSAESLVNTLNGMIDQEYANLFQYYSGWYFNTFGKIHDLPNSAIRRVYETWCHNWYRHIETLGGVESPLEQFYTYTFLQLFFFIIGISVSVIACIFWLNKKRKNEKCEESKPSCTGVPRQGPASSGSQRPDTDRRRYVIALSLSLLQPSFLMSKTRSYAIILIGSRLFLTAMAIHLSLRVAPLDLQQGGNSRIPYVHVPAARMSILLYITTALNTFFFLLTKHPLFLRSSGTGTEMGAFSTLFTLVTGGFRGRPMWGTFWVWDARLTSVFISFLIYLGALFFQKLPVEPAPISIRAGPIDIPIIKSSVNWWNTSHQPGSISRSDISIHVSMPIPILSNFANSPFSTPILFVLETRLPIPSFLESPLTEEIEAREGKT
ncbi:ATP synthase subunit H protein (Va0H) (atp6H) (Atp6v0e) [Orobanche hederae]